MSWRLRECFSTSVPWQEAARNGKMARALERSPHARAPPRADPLTARGLSARRSQAELGEAPRRYSDRILPKTAEAAAKLNEPTLADKCCESPRQGVPKTPLTTGCPAQPAIFSVIGSKLLLMLDFSSAAFRFQRTKPWPLGDPSVYLPSWKSEDSQPSSGKRRRERVCEAPRTLHPKGEIERGRFFYFFRS
jgi:hypothetical protein